MLYSYTLLTILNSFDYNHKNGGRSFKADHKNWRESEMMKDFLVWSLEQLGESSS